MNSLTWEQFLGLLAPLALVVIAGAWRLLDYVLPKGRHFKCLDEITVEHEILEETDEEESK